MSIPNTHFGAETIAAWLTEPKKILFAGIGGVSMSSLAHISHLRGHTVTGYDRTPSTLTAQLEEMGIRIHYESDAAHAADIDMLVYTVAIPADLLEYCEAIRRGIPVVSRADFLGYLMCGYRTRLAVCGMHGKTTTTSMLERIFRIAGTDPTVSCGAPMKDVDGHCDRIGREDYFIFEACEYMDSFLDFYPTEAIVLNIEPDHLDYFSGIAQIEESFSRFLARTGDQGTVYLNISDENVLRAAAGYPGRIVTFAIGREDADYTTDNLRYEHGFPSFTLKRRGEALCDIHLNVPGSHNVWDALAAAAAAIENGIDPTTVAHALAGFDGASRRMDYKGKTSGGADIYDDYAHHPTEITSSIGAAAALDGERLFCVFQPHTYSRTKELFDDFSSALANPAAAEVLLAEIYAARETDTRGMSAELLAEAVRKKGGNCRALSSFDAIAAELKSKAKSGDIILVMGAGDITRLCSALV